MRVIIKMHEVGKPKQKATLYFEEKCREVNGLLNNCYIVDKIEVKS